MSSTSRVMHSAKIPEPHSRSLAALIVFVAVPTAFLLFVLGGGQQSEAQQKEITFSRDVAPIFYKHCASCHQPDDVAPFSVVDYKDVLPWKQTIRQKVSTREMAFICGASSTQRRTALRQ